jgi:hypothetical protein
MPCEGVKSLFTTILMALGSSFVSSTAVWRSVLLGFFYMHFSAFA